jgi:predicted RNA methylase
MAQEYVSAAQRWRSMVEAEHAQSEWARGQASAPEDFWESFAERFRPEPSRTDDPIVLRLLREVEPHHTVIDVRAGGGRLALPLSLHCQRVVVVEPSASMGQILEEEARWKQRDNIDLVASA